VALSWIAGLLLSLLVALFVSVCSTLHIAPSKLRSGSCIAARVMDACPWDADLAVPHPRHTRRVLPSW
jgi:hypothetical protein